MSGPTIVALGDIHSNAPALRACVERIDQIRPDMVIFMGDYISDCACPQETLALMKLVKVFSYGFITLISLIAAANVFNTIYTNISLRRRDMTMLRSIGMSGRSMLKMMNIESLIYGLLSLAAGLPVSAGITYLIYRYIYENGTNIPFTLPWGNLVFAVFTVFAVVFASMLYATAKIKKGSLIDSLKDENT